MDICIYYDESKEVIIDVAPSGLDPEIRAKLEEIWQQHITRQILIAISQGETRLPDIQKTIGHSPSTLHEALQKLTQSGFVQYEMSYKGRKHKILTSTVLCVTKNPKSKEKLQRFFKGLWVDSEKTKIILNQLNEEPDKWWTREELSAKTSIPVDEIELLLSNFDSQTTRALSQFLKEPPFEKKELYKIKT